MTRIEKAAEALLRLALSKPRPIDFLDDKIAQENQRFKLEALYLARREAQVCLKLSEVGEPPEPGSKPPVKLSEPEKPKVTPKVVPGEKPVKAEYPDLDKYLPEMKLTVPAYRDADGQGSCYSTIIWARNKHEKKDPTWLGPRWSPKPGWRPQTRPRYAKT